MQWMRQLPPPAAFRVWIHAASRNVIQIVSQPSSHTRLVTCSTIRHILRLDGWIEEIDRRKISPEHKFRLQLESSSFRNIKKKHALDCKKNNMSTLTLQLQYTLDYEGKPWAHRSVLRYPIIKGSKLKSKWRIIWSKFSWQFSRKALSQQNNSEHADICVVTLNWSVTGARQQD
jgi:hypothetical protein